MSIDALLGFDEARLKRGAAKLTHVGEQTGPIATVVIQSYYYLAPLEKFRTWHTPSLPYGNDELPIVLNFSVLPQELKRIFAEAKRVWSEPPGNRPSLSFIGMVDAPEGLQGGELLFTYQGGVELHRALAAAIDQDNKIGRIVLRHQRESAYAG